MTQKALFAGISNYAKPTTILEAGVPEAREWKRLLTLKTAYGFPDTTDNIRLRLDSAATRDTVLTDLTTWLLPNAKAGDQLVFVFSGHGTQRWVPGGNGTTAEDSLLMYHEPDASRLVATIGDSDLALAVKDASLAPGVLFTVILDCCSAGGLKIWPKPPQFLSQSQDDRQLLEETKIQFVPLLSRAEMSRIETVVRLGEFAGPPFVGVTRPIIVAACEAGREAHQPPFTTNPRLYFSSNAIPELERTPKQTFDSFIVNVRNRMTLYDQKPTLGGNKLRALNPFLS